MKKTISALFISLLLLANSAVCQVWNTQNLNATTIGANLFVVSAIDNNSSWGLLQYDSHVARTIDGGLNWELKATPPNQTPTSFQALSSDTAWIATTSFPDSAKLWKTSDGGQTWIENTGIVGHFVFINFFNSNEGVAFSDPDSTGWPVFTTNDGGVIWNQVSVPAPLTGEFCMDSHHAVLGDNVWIPSTKGRIFYSNDKGNTWNVSLIDSVTFPDNYQLAFYSAMDGIALRHHASSGTVTNVYRTADGGITWNIVPHSGFVSSSFFGGLFIVPNTNVIIANGEGSLVYGSSFSVDSGATWNIIDTVNKYGALNAKDWNSLWAGQSSTAAGIGGVAKWHGSILTVADFTEENILSCYPNPVTDFLVVTSLHDIESIGISDLFGKQMMNIQNENLEERIDVTDFSDGIYIIRVKSNGKLITKKFVKQ